MNLRIPGGNRNESKPAYLNNMQYRPLGNTGLKISVIGLGCSRLSQSVFEEKKVDVFSLLDCAIDLGINFFDTADSYGYGGSEEILGKSFGGRRDKAIIATKVGYLPSSLARFGKYLIPFISPIRPLLRKKKKSLKGHSKKRQSFDIKHLKKALEGSLRRLRTDYIDLYQLHSPPKEVLQNEDEEVFDFLNRIKKEGKIRFWGISLNEVEDGIICLKRKNISSFQIAFNFIDDEAQHVLFPNLNPDIGIIARVPFARGLLTEKKEVLTGFHDVDPQKNKKIKQKLDSIQLEATKKEKGVSEVATEFILNHPEVTTAIIGTRSIEHLKANLKAFS